MNLLRNFFALISILIVLLSIVYTKNLRLDASSDTLILQNDETFMFYEEYNKIFPTKNFLILAIKSDKEIDKDYLKILDSINEKIKKIKNVESTFTIYDAPILIANNSSFASLANDKIENLRNTNIDLKKILNEFSASPILKNQIINEGKNLSSIIIYIKENLELKEIKQIKKNKNLKEINKKYRILKELNNKEKEKTIKEIREVIKINDNKYQYYLGGIDMIASDTLSFIKNDILIFSFAVIIFIIIVLLFIYKEIKWVLIPLISTTYAVLIMTGIIGFLKWEITAISANFISLMLILSISMNIHIINNYQFNYFDKEIKNKLKKTFSNMLIPCFYTSLTTIVAFGSLLFSGIKPIIDFGNIMMVGLIIIFLTSFTILPLIIYFFPKINKSKMKNFKSLNKFYNLSTNRYKMIFTVNLLIFIISIIGILNLNVENSFINYFKSNTQIYQGMKLIDTQLGGTTPLDIIVKFKDDDYETSREVNDDLLSNEDLDLDLDLDDSLFEEEIHNQTWFTEDKIDTVYKIHNYLENRIEIGKVQSLQTLIEMAELINKKSLSIFELTILYNEIPIEYKKILLDPFLSRDTNMIKISARVKDSNNIKREELINDIEKFITKEFDNIDVIKVNGLLVLYNNLLQSLFSSQIKSFGIILITIFIMFLLLFRSIKLSIIGIIPNIIASTSILGLIGLMQIPLDIMTITIAAITIGIAVDNTIHYIYRIKNLQNKIKDKKQLISETHNSVGRAVLTTSLTIAFGFSVLSLSSFIPTVLFGIFTALAMLIAMIGVLITLPAILYKL